MHWPCEQRAFAVEAYFSNNHSVIAVQRAFRRRFEISPRGHVPGRKSILLWVNIFKETGNVSKKKEGPPRTVITPENVERVRVSMLQSPQLSARKHAVELGMSGRSFRRILHDELHLQPYKMVVTQQLTNRHFVTQQTSDSNDNESDKTEMQLDAKTVDSDVTDTKDNKIDEKVGTLNKKIKTKTVMESSSVVIMDGHKIDQLSNEAQKDGNSGFPFVNVKTELDAIEECTGDSELKAANSNCQKKSLKFNKCNPKSDRKLLMTQLKADSDVKPYKCDLCGKAFSQKWHYDKHRRIHMGENPFKCDVCAKELSDKSAHDKHRRIHTGEKPFICEFCRKAFSQKSHYDKHRRIHTGEKPYKCDFCAKEFSDKSACDRHRRIHTGEKPYKCEFCIKAFSDKSCHDRHRRTHTGEQLYYKCEFCAKNFTQQSNYNNHRQTHIAKKPYKCDLCATEFPDKSGYDMHRLTHTVRDHSK